VCIITKLFYACEKHVDFISDGNPVYQDFTSGSGEPSDSITYPCLTGLGSPLVLPGKLHVYFNDSSRFNIYFYYEQKFYYLGDSPLWPCGAGCSSSQGIQHFFN